MNTHTNQNLVESGAVSAPPQRDTQGRLNPYPLNVRVNGNNVFLNEKYVGYIDHVKNWGTDFLARCEHGKPNKFFTTKTEAVLYMTTNYNKP